MGKGAWKAACSERDLEGYKAQIGHFPCFSIQTHHLAAHTLRMFSLSLSPPHLSFYTQRQHLCVHLHTVNRALPLIKTHSEEVIMKHDWTRAESRRSSTLCFSLTAKSAGLLTLILIQNEYSIPLQMLWFRNLSMFVCCYLFVPRILKPSKIPRELKERTVHI